MVEKIPYTKNEERFITLLRIMNAKSIKEMKTYARRNKKMLKIVEKITQWFQKERPMKLEEYIEMREADAAFKAEEVGKEKGIEKGIEIGKIENNISNAKAMLKENIPIEVIEKVTKLPKSKILTLM